MVFRIARHTSDLIPIITFYRDLIGLDLLGSFEDHEDYSGVFLGKKNENWHLEFTISSNPPEHHFDEDDLFVFYPENKDNYEEIIEKLKSAGIKKLKALNPYWNRNGFLCKDPDGYGIVISDLKIKRTPQTPLKTQ